MLEKIKMTISVEQWAGACVRISNVPSTRLFRKLKSTWERDRCVRWIALSRSFRHVAISDMNIDISHYRVGLSMVRRVEWCFKYFFKNNVTYLCVNSSGFKTLLRFGISKIFVWIFFWVFGRRWSSPSKDTCITRHIRSLDSGASVCSGFLYPSNRNTDMLCGRNR